MALYFIQIADLVFNYSWHTQSAFWQAFGRAINAITNILIPVQADIPQMAARATQ